MVKDSITGVEFNIIRWYYRLSDGRLILKIWNDAQCVERPATPVEQFLVESGKFVDHGAYGGGV